MNPTVGVSEGAAGLTLIILIATAFASRWRWHNRARRRFRLHDEGAAEAPKPKLLAARISRRGLSRIGPHRDRISKATRSMVSTEEIANDEPMDEAYPSTSATQHHERL